MSPVLTLLQQAKTPKRLFGLGVHLQSFPPEAVRDLDASTADWVHLVPDTALSDASWPKLRVRLARANRSFIVYGSPASSDVVVRAMRDGAFDFVYMDEPDSRWHDAATKAAESQRLWIELYAGDRPHDSRLFVGASAVMESLRQSVHRIGPTSASVLIIGESGSGKEKVANALHVESGVPGEFIGVNCAAIPRDLIEAELFGAEKGAYTGSVQARQGLVEQAAGGTLFLDELGELELSLQPKLLRFLETRRARRVGGRQEYRAEVRIIAATNRDLDAEIDRNMFRADLFYRLAEMVVKVPPLRNHPEDIPSLADLFLNEANTRFGKNFVSIEPLLLSSMMEHTWPGNIRELRTTISRLVIMHDGSVLRREWWDAPLKAVPVTAPTPASAPVGMLNRNQKRQRARQLLDESGHDQSWTAAQLGIHPTTLFRWIKAGKV